MQDVAFICTLGKSSHCQTGGIATGSGPGPAPAAQRHCSNDLPMNVMVTSVLVGPAQQAQNTGRPPGPGPGGGRGGKGRPSLQLRPFTAFRKVSNGPSWQLISIKTALTT